MQFAAEEALLPKVKELDHETATALYHDNAVAISGSSSFILANTATVSDDSLPAPALLPLLPLLLLLKAQALSYCAAFAQSFANVASAVAAAVAFSASRSLI